MPNGQPNNNNLCKQHSGIIANIAHIQAENHEQWGKIQNVEQKTDKILNRLTIAAVSFGLMTIALALNLIKYFT